MLKLELKLKLPINKVITNIEYNIHNIPNLEINKVIRRFLPGSTRTAKSVQDAGPRVQAPMRFLLVPIVAALCTLIELPRLHHQGDE